MDACARTWASGQVWADTGRPGFVFFCGVYGITNVAAKGEIRNAGAFFFSLFKDT